MSDEATQTIRAIFRTREAADRAVEHLVQQFGIDRADIFIEARSADNTSGTQRSGGDASTDPDEGSALDAALGGYILVSADLPAEKLSDAQRAFCEVGAVDLTTE